jgi:uncharacterized protein YigE (DUF2233 family)
MATTGQLAQAAGTTSAAQLYALPSNRAASGLVMTVSNVTGTADTFSIYQKDSGGTPWPDSTALHKDVAIAANATVRITIPPMSTSGGTLAVDCGVASAVTFTLSGTLVLT